MARSFSFAWLLLVVVGGQSARADAPQIISVVKIWDQGKHNAFTDLIRWHGKWYCTFREADAHVGGDGQLRVLESADGFEWQPVALVSEAGIDLRDPKLSITPDDQLMMVAGGSVYEGKALKSRRSRVARRVRATRARYRGSGAATASSPCADSRAGCSGWAC